MRKFMTGLMVAAMSASMAVVSVVPTQAAPWVAPAVPTASQDVQKVQDRRWRRHGNREWRRGHSHRNHWRGNSRWRDRDDHRYWRGHRGYRSWRRGYRERNGWWYPLAAFTAGAVIGNAINQPRVIYRDGGSAHVQWCYNRYRSYRASDNTFQPYNGPRRQCNSPYN